MGEYARLVYLVVSEEEVLATRSALIGFRTETSSAALRAPAARASLRVSIVTVRAGLVAAVTQEVEGLLAEKNLNI